MRRIVNARKANVRFHTREWWQQLFRFCKLTFVIETRWICHPKRISSFSARNVHNSTSDGHLNFLYLIEHQQTQMSIKAIHCQCLIKRGIAFENMVFFGCVFLIHQTFPLFFIFQTIFIRFYSSSVSAILRSKGVVILRFSRLPSTTGASSPHTGTSPRKPTSVASRTNIKQIFFIILIKFGI